MSMKTVTMSEVSCQKCGKTEVVKVWRDLRHKGWAVPNDGGLQLCPECLKCHKCEVFTPTKPAESAFQKAVREYLYTNYPQLDTQTMLKRNIKSASWDKLMEVWGNTIPCLRTFREVMLNEAIKKLVGLPHSASLVEALKDKDKE